MKIRIATWNMAYWQYRKYFEEAWDYYLKEIDADREERMGSNLYS